VYFIFRNEIINKSGSVYAKTKRQKQKQKQYYNERKKNSKAENKATREQSNSKWAVNKRNQREKKKIETIGNAILVSEKSNTTWASYRRKQRQEQKMKRLKDKERQHRQQNLTTFDIISKNREPIYKKQNGEMSIS
jgi:hypothetical protein